MCNATNNTISIYHNLLANYFFGVDGDGDDAVCQLTLPIWERQPTGESGKNIVNGNGSSTQQIWQPLK